MDTNLLLSGKTQVTPPAPNDGDVIPLSMTNAGRMRTDVSGTVAISGTPSVNSTIVNTPNVNATITGTPSVNSTVVNTPAVTISGTPTVNSTGTPANGSAYAVTSAASTNAASVKATAGNLFEISAFNSGASTVYIRLYNKASAPTVGTDLPILTIPVAASAFVNAQFGHVGKRFTSGIAISITGAAANNDATSAVAGALVSATYN